MRRDIISKAVEECLKEAYTYVYPKVTWEKFIEENKEYTEKYYDGGTLKENISYSELPPKPFEFYYLPERILKSLVESYDHDYRISPEIKDNIQTLIQYFNRPIRDKYIYPCTDEHGDWHPGYRDYEHFTPLKEVIGEDSYNKVIEYMNEASNFYRWDTDYQQFSCGVYLGASPNSNRERVIGNWKNWRNTDIIIPDDKEIYKDFYDWDEED